MQPIDYLRQHLEQHGKIPFVDFMQQALYAPRWGYYTQSRAPIGAAGDFITAPELTPLFGYTLATHFSKILRSLKTPHMLEFGAGTGRLCIDILTQLEALNALPETYFILEVSGALKTLQQEKIQAEIPHLAHRVQWLTALPQSPFEGIIVANEVLDAMPVHRFLKTDEGIFESMIGLDENLQLIETFEPCTAPELSAHVTQVLTHHVTPFASEANLNLQSWLQAASEILTQGLVLLIDYGFPQHEYYHPDRNKGTLMCHYQHQAHPNPLAHPGLEDITAHVDFTHVADCALQAGFHVSGYTNQASFLLENGLLSLLKDSQNIDNINTQQAIKQLLQPHEMGELFKVMALTKGIHQPLLGFQQYDKRASLDP